MVLVRSWNISAMLHKFVHIASIYTFTMRYFTFKRIVTVSYMPCTILLMPFFSLDSNLVPNPGCYSKPFFIITVKVIIVYCLLLVRKEKIEFCAVCCINVQILLLCSRKMETCAGLRPGTICIENFADEDRIYF